MVFHIGKNYLNTLKPIFNLYVENLLKGNFNIL